MRRLFPALAVSLLILSACSGSSTETGTCDQDFWDGTVGVCIPGDWVVLDRSVLRQRGIEAPEEVVVAFESKAAVGGQFPRILVTKEVLARQMSSTEYSDESIRAVSNIPAYEQLDSEEIEVDGKTVHMHVFSGQPDPERPQQRFYQVSAVSGENGYTATAMTPLSIDRDLQSQVETIVKSLTFEERVVAEE